jgi:enamine deaminase RidA (YjgF/YER057c/UK114 family)
MEVDVEAQRVTVHDRAGVSVRAGVGTSGADDLEAMLGAVRAALDEHGLGLADVVRTRLHAATRAARDAASRVRFRHLAGPARCATSSYIDPSRFSGGDGAALWLLALEGARVDKVVVEYEPAQPPCRFVASGGLVFLSGVTSSDPTFDDQLARIAARIGETLAIAGERLGAPVRPSAVQAWVHRDLAPSALADLGERLALGGVPLAMERCDGYSAPGKLIEVEVDAVVT